uniref:Uncharacterized protein n=1 Tax=Anguilla anguilla TaxID=7936 RepID=A0A0E9Q929_ANGAN
MSNFGLGDSWRLKNSLIREYSYFSPPHQSFSRIDFFLTSTRSYLIFQVPKFIPS